MNCKPYGRPLDTGGQQRSKEELQLLLRSKARHTMNRFVTETLISILISAGLFVYLIITSINRADGVCYLAINIILLVIDPYHSFPDTYPGKLCAAALGPAFEVWLENAPRLDQMAVRKILQTPPLPDPAALHPDPAFHSRVFRIQTLPGSFKQCRVGHRVAGSLAHWTVRLLLHRRQDPPPPQTAAGIPTGPPQPAFPASDNTIQVFASTVQCAVPC